MDYNTFYSPYSPLVDFGLCSDVSQGEVVHMVGSPFWMPPEMIRRDPHGLPVDIWSLGVCLMELANGHPPNRKSSIKVQY
jgi:serine/threonine protein kinase